MERYRGVWTLFKREVLRYLARPGQTVVPPVISAGLYVVVFGFVLGTQVREIQGFAYVTYIFPGLLFMSAATASFHNATFSLFMSRWDKFIADLLVSPLSYLDMVLAYYLASVVRGLLVGGLILAAGMFLIPLPLPYPGQLILALTVSCLVFSGLGLIIGLWADDWDQMGLIQTFAISPLMFMGGVFFSTANLPEGFKWINEANPIYYMVSATRHALLGTADTSFLAGLLPTALLAVLFGVVVFVLFRRGYKLRT